MSTLDHVRPVPQPATHTVKFGRLAFLGLAAGTAGILVGSKRLSLSVPRLSFTPGGTSVNGFTIYTVTAGYPAFQADSYRLTVNGLVKHPMTMTIDDILRHPAVTQTKFYQC